MEVKLCTSTENRGGASPETSLSGERGGGGGGGGGRLQLLFPSSNIIMYQDYGRYSRRVTNFSEWLTMEFSYPFLWNTTC